MSTSHVVSRSQRRVIDRHRLDRVVQLYLSECYRHNSPPHVGELAEFIRVPRPSLSRLARRVTGRPLSQYFRDQQLQYAETLLRTTPLSMQDIALSTGFGTAHTLIRAFKKEFHTTPGHYRKRYQLNMASSSPRP